MLGCKLGYFFDHEILGLEVSIGGEIVRNAFDSILRVDTYIFCCANVDEPFRIVNRMVRITHDSLEFIHATSGMGNFNSTSRQS